MLKCALHGHTRNSSLGAAPLRCALLRCAFLLRSKVRCRPSVVCPLDGAVIHWITANTPPHPLDPWHIFGSPAGHSFPAHTPVATTYLNGIAVSDVNSNSRPDGAVATRPAPSPAMLKTVRSIASLLLSYGLLLVAMGLFNTLLGVRSQIEGFSTEVIGVIMAGYFAGLVPYEFSDELQHKPLGKHDRTQSERCM